MATVKCCVDAAGKVYVVVFQQNHVEQSDTMVHATADADCLFLHHAHAGGRFSCVKYPGVRAFQPLYVFVCHCSDAAHALHDVQHQAFGLQEAAYFSCDDHGHIAGTDVGAVIKEHLDRHCRVKAVKHFFGDTHTGEYAFFFYQQVRLAGSLFGDAAEGGVVTVANVFRESQVDQSVVQFVYTVHRFVIFIDGYVGRKITSFPAKTPSGSPKSASCVVYLPMRADGYTVARKECKVRNKRFSNQKMKTVFLVVGRTTDQYLDAMIKDYIGRVKHYTPFEMQVVPELKNTKALSPEQQKEREGEAILRQIQSGDRVVLLDEGGREFRSTDFAVYLSQAQMGGQRRIVFVVGGPYGFSPQVYAAAREKVSLSRMTFSHQMIRLLFVEQFYRAMTILRGEPYHHE